MRSASLAATLFTTVALPLTASATTTDAFTITGQDINNVPYQVTFSLDLTSPASGSSADGFGYTASGSINHVSDLFNIYEYVGADTFLDLYDYNNGADGDYAQQLVLLPTGSLQLFNNLPGPTPTVNLGTWSGYDDTSCDASLHAPSLGGGPMSALALVSVPVVQTSCGSLVSVSVTASSSAPPTTVTPEPASLALFGTGALGLFGLARRHFVR